MGWCNFQEIDYLCDGIKNGTNIRIKIQTLQCCRCGKYKNTHSWQELSAIYKQHEAVMYGGEGSIIPYNNGYMQVNAKLPKWKNFKVIDGGKSK